MIECACGCGVEIEPRDAKNRPRRFKHGHHARGNKHREGLPSWNKGMKFPYRPLGPRQDAYKNLGRYAEPGYLAGYAPWNAGKHYMPANIEQFIKSSEGHRFRRGQLAGSAHPNWKGGITPKNTAIRMSHEYQSWRKEVFARDNWTCVLCGQRGRDLVADHILAFAYYPELRLDVNNGRTLCKNCNYESTYVRKEWKGGVSRPTLHGV